MPDLPKGNQRCAISWSVLLMKGLSGPTGLSAPASAVVLQSKQSGKCRRRQSSAPDRLWSLPAPVSVQHAAVQYPAWSPSDRSATSFGSLPALQPAGSVKPAASSVFTSAWVSKTMVVMGWFLLTWRAVGCQEPGGSCPGTVEYPLL